MAGSINARSSGWAQPIQLRLVRTANGAARGKKLTDLGIAVGYFPIKWQCETGARQIVSRFGTRLSGCQLRFSLSNLRHKGDQRWHRFTGVEQGIIGDGIALGLLSTGSTLPRLRQLELEQGAI